jgi:transposase
VRVYLYIAPCDMRRSFEGLHGLVARVMGLDAMAGHLFVFANRKRDRVKILYWDQDGFAIWSKRPEEGTYAMPFDRGNERRAEINNRWFALTLTVQLLSYSPPPTRMFNSSKFLISHSHTTRPFQPSGCCPFPRTPFSACGAVPPLRSG